MKDTFTAIDLAAITKPYAKHLECLGKVSDGSDDHRDQTPVLQPLSVLQ
ncbi:MAG: hypothetical protein NTV34_03010 [Proteobacteria bacterium]|nr:hypothetical protein [Pseudomonadota bacterium]